MLQWYADFQARLCVVKPCGAVMFLHWKARENFLQKLFFRQLLSLLSSSSHNSLWSAIDTHATALLRFYPRIARRNSNCDVRSIFRSPQFFPISHGLISSCNLANPTVIVELSTVIHAAGWINALCVRASKRKKVEERGRRFRNFLLRFRHCLSRYTFHSSQTPSQKLSYGWKLL